MVETRHASRPCATVHRAAPRCRHRDPPPRGSAARARRAARSRALRFAALLPDRRRRSTRAPRAERGALHDLQRRSRGQRRAGTSHAAQRSGAPPLSQRRVLPRTSTARVGTRRHRSTARRPRAPPLARGIRGRSHLGRTAQGVRQRALGSATADEHHRLASAEGGRHGGVDRSRGSPAIARADRRGRPVAHRPARGPRRDRARLDRGVLVRRCIAESLDGAGRDQRRSVGVVPARARAAPVRLRGQRHRRLGANARRLDRGTHAFDAGNDLRRRRRARPHGGLRTNASRRRRLSLHAQPGVSPSPLRARVGPRGQRRRQRVPLAARARERRGSGSGAPHRAVAARGGRPRSDVSARRDRARPRRGAHALS